MYGGAPGGAWAETGMGSGQFATPWERMQWAKSSRWPSVCWVGWTPLGSSCRQAFSAACNCELVTPSSCGATLGKPLGISLLLLGSGNLGTPWERMHCEKASAFWEFPGWGPVGPPAFDEPAGLVDVEPLCVVVEPTCAT